MASITSDSCPSAEHMMTTALVSRLMISRVASMPLLNGITMSIVVRSGLSSLYFSTASRPLRGLAHDLEAAGREDVLDHVAHEDRVVDDQDPLAMESVPPESCGVTDMSSSC